MINLYNQLGVKPCTLHVPTPHLSLRPRYLALLPFPSPYTIIQLYLWNFLVKSFTCQSHLSLANGLASQSTALPTGPRRTRWNGPKNSKLLFPGWITESIAERVPVRERSRMIVSQMWWKIVGEELNTLHNFCVWYFLSSFTFLLQNLNFGMAFALNG